MPDNDNKKTTETKIVKAAPTKGGGKDASSSKVQIRAVDIAIIEAQRQRAKNAAATAARNKNEGQKQSSSAPPVGRPMPKTVSGAPVTRNDAPSGRPVPLGKPMPKNAVPRKKSDVQQSAEPEAKTSTEVKLETAETEPTSSAVTKAAVSAEEKKTAVPEKAEPVVDYFDEPKIGVKIIKKADREELKRAEERKAAAKKQRELAEQRAKEKKIAEKAESKQPEKKSDNTEVSVPGVQVDTKSEPQKTAEPQKTVSVPEKPAKKEEPINYTPGIGLKIISRAADQPKPEKKPVEPKKSSDRKPKEYKGGQRRDGKSGAAPEGDSSSRRQSAGRNGSKPGAPGAAKGKVVAYTAPVGSTDNRRKKKKNAKDERREEYDFNPAALAKESHKKHSKYKEKVEEPVETAVEIEARTTGGIIINVPITVAGFCEQVEKSTSEAIMALMKMGIMANINQNLDEETAVLLGMELGVNVLVNKAEEIVLEDGIDTHEDAASELLPRAPIITVMGHVDHGKTSLLDAIRSTNVTAGEAGGITQAIGASEVEINGQKIVFLDTPGHEAFTAMRARGAHVTDIAVLVVAADDSVKPQTIESISHAKAAGVPIIVAINKMDKPGANPDRVKKDLADQGVLVEDWGGNVISVPVSAKTGEGIKTLLEMILLQAEVLELKANPDRMASGSVIEARLDKNKGPVATLLVMNGTLSAGAAVVAGTAYGRIRVMTNSHGETIRKAGPATAVEITGLAEVPEAGDEFYMVKEEKTAREIAEKRKMKLREEVMAKNSSVSLEKLFSQLEEGEVRDLNLIIKADVQGSVGALEQSLEKLKNENVRVRIIHTGVGAINESDVMLAGTSGAVIIGFNVRPSSAVQAMADRDGVEIRTYRIIYEIIDDIEAAMKGMLDPVFKEVILGKVEVRNTFKVPNVGIIAGAYVTEGKVTRNASVRLVRDGIVIHEGTISSLKRFKDDVREVAQGYECGIGIEKYNDIKEGDVIECFTMEEVER